MRDSVKFLDALAAGYAGCGCDGPDDGLVLAVSGGADSMSLLHATCQLWPERKEQMVVAHVNHQLRGSRSTADAEFVGEITETLGLELVTLTCDVRRLKETSGGSVEEVARRSRYQLLQDTALSKGFGSVVCAHHQDDQAETVLHNIIRGTGLRGVAGMSLARPMCEGVLLIRPMLKFNRRTIEAFLLCQQLAWCVDESNASDEFTRNRIRRHLMPLLAKDYNPQVVSSLTRLASHARDVEEQVRQAAQRCVDDVVLELQPDICRLDRTKLALWPASVVRASLRLIWDHQSWPQQDMTQTHWTDLTSSLRNTDQKPDACPGVELSVSSTVVRIFRSK